jgi:transposase
MWVRSSRRPTGYKVVRWSAAHRSARPIPISSATHHNIAENKLDTRSPIQGGLSIDPAGFDAGKKIKGKKRHVLVDTQGLLLQAIIHAADIQDRDGGVLLMSTLFGLYPFLLKLYADSGYQGPKFQQGLKRVCRKINVEIVKRSEAGNFVVLPKRWIVERTIGWLNRCRRLAKDWECLNRNALAFLRWASIRIMVRKLCQETT